MKLLARRLRFPTLARVCLFFLSFQSPNVPSLPTNQPNGPKGVEKWGSQRAGSDPIKNEPNSPFFVNKLRVERKSKKIDKSRTKKTFELNIHHTLTHTHTHIHIAIQSLNMIKYITLIN